jgi:hypothetical protein
MLLDKKRYPRCRRFESSSRGFMDEHELARYAEKFGITAADIEESVGHRSVYPKTENQGGNHRVMPKGCI